MSRLLLVKIALFSLTGGVCACSTLPTLASESALEFVDHGYSQMTVLGISEKSASSALNQNISVDNLRRHPEFKFSSNEVAYIGRLVSRLQNAKAVAECNLESGIRWIAEFHTGDARIVYVSDGKVISGPEGYCRSAAGLQSFDVLN